MEIHVLLRDSAVPTVEQWQQALRDAGFNLQLDTTLAIRKDKGFSPAIYNGVETGFEFDILRATDVIGDKPELMRQIGDRDISANFRFGGDLTEAASAVIAASVLAKITDGLLYDPQEKLLANGEEAIASAKEMVREIARN